MKKSSQRTLSLLAYWHHVGTDNMRKVVAAAGTSWRYAMAMAYGSKQPSYEMAKALITAARELTPGWAPDIETVMEGGTAERPPYKHGRKIEPSHEFIASQKAMQAAQQRRETAAA